MDPGLYDLYRTLRPTCLADPELDLGEDITQPGGDRVKDQECRKLCEHFTIGHRTRRQGARLGEGGQVGGSEDSM